MKTCMVAGKMHGPCTENYLYITLIRIVSSHLSNCHCLVITEGLNIQVAVAIMNKTKRI